MHKLTGKQSKMARSLLKWNTHDLAANVKNIQAKRIDSFEQGTVHIVEWENDEMVRAYKKEGIQFKADMEVTLSKEKAKREKPHTSSGEGMRIVVDINQESISDAPAEITAPPDAAALEKSKKEKKEEKH